MNPPDMTWVSDAACADHPTLEPTAWLDPPKFGHTPLDVRKACMACPVFIQCDTHASTHEEWGIWAGQSHLERYGRNPRHDASAVRGPRKPYRRHQEEASA